MINNGQSHERTDRDSSLEETIKKVRIHKHNYAGEFGNVVIDPMLTLAEELIDNPQIFSKEEREWILNGLRQAFQIRGRYDFLGYTLQEQMTKVKEEMIPVIKKNSEICKRIISKDRKFVTPGLVEILRWSDEKIPDICSKLVNIEFDDKGEAKPIALLSFIERLFIEDKEVRARKGLPSFDFSVFGREFSDIKVLVDGDGFNNVVIHNIIENLYKHAFVYFQPAESSKTVNRNHFLFWNKNNRHNIDDEIVFDNYPEVQIRFEKDSDNANNIIVIIENNGSPFLKDVNTVFEYGIGEGTGLGLFSVADFLRKYNSTIAMVSTPNEKFTVHFILKIPIYEQEIQNTMA